MAVRITLKNYHNDKIVEHFYKTTKSLKSFPFACYIKEGRIDLDIHSIKDIKNLKIFLESLESVMNIPQEYK